MKAVLAALGAAISTGVFAVVLLGAPAYWAVALGLPAAALASLVGLLPRAEEADWAPEPEPVDGVTVLQASSLAHRMLLAADDRHRFVNQLQPRLRELALGTLRTRHGVRSLDDPEAERLLGAELHQLITSPLATLPDPRRLTALLDRLEGL